MKFTFKRNESVYSILIDTPIQNVDSFGIKGFQKTMYTLYVI